MSAILAQYLLEARDLLEDASRGLLALERDPGDAETVHAVFRALHTVKGGAAIVELPPVQTAAHAAEDVLDAIRDGRLALRAEITDLLLHVVDRIGGWLDAVDAGTPLGDPEAAESRSLGAAVRAVLPADVVAADAHARPRDPARIAGTPLAEWLARLPAGARAAARAALDAGTPVAAVGYTPGPDCFFRGDDPLRAVSQVPGLLHVQVVQPDGWGDLDTFDPYVCRLAFRLLAAAAPDALATHFRYVADETDVVPLDADALRDEAPPDDGSPAGAFARLVREQARILALPADDGERTARVAAVVRAVRNGLVFLGLERDVVALDAAAAAAEGGDLAPLRAFVDGWAPPGAGAARPAAAAGPAVPVAAAPPVAPAIRFGDAGAGTGRTGRTLKVDPEKVDALLELVSELVVAKNALPYLARRAEDEFGCRRLANDIRDQHGVLHRIVERLHRTAMEVRTLPVSTVFDRFPRLVRDLARRMGKEIDLVVEGGDTAADKTVIERLADPLVHLVRNAADHGLEPPDERIRAGKPRAGVLRLAARAESDHVEIVVHDDGRGIDPAAVKRAARARGLLDDARMDALGDREALRLVFAPGFSTAACVSEVSGRGVGMDVVLRAVEGCGGAVDLDSRPGHGTTVRLSLPLTMAVTQVLVVGAGGEAYGIPLERVVETLRVRRAAIHRVGSGEACTWRGRVLRLVRLAERFGHASPAGDTPDRDAAVLVVRSGAGEAGVVVEEFHERTEVIVRPLEGLLAKLPGWSGTAVLGDGRVLLVLDPRELG